jgi:2-dehydropantoate 2-reductase
LVTVKAQSLTGVAGTIGPLLGKETAVVTAMNGVPWWFFHGLRGSHAGRDARLESLDPGGVLSRAIPTERVVGCVIHLAASTPEPGLISHNMGAKLIVGEPGGKNTDRTRRIADALGAAGFEVVTSNAIERDFWVKLLGNVSFNPVSALTAATADRLIQSDEIKAYMVEIMREVLAIGRAVGVDADIDPEARIDMARVLGPFKTSMLQDLEAGKRLEIDGLLAGTLEIARKAGVRAPFTESLFGLIRARAQSTGQYQ